MIRSAIGSGFRETFHAVEPRRAAAIALLAFIVYAVGAHWGLPDGGAADHIHAWGVDDEAPMGSLGQVYGIFRDNPDANLGYPLMHPILVGAVSAPYLLYRFSVGDLRPVQQDYPFGFENPRRALRQLSWLAHLLSALLAAGVIVAAYVAGATWWGERAGLWSAAFMLTSFPMFYYGRTANVDMTMLFFMAWAFVSYSIILKDGFSMTQAVVLGTMTGAAAATKEPAAAAFLLLPVVIAVSHLGGMPSARRRKWTTWSPFVVAAGATIVAFGLGSGWFLAPTRFFAHLEYMRTRMADIADASMPWVIRYPATWSGQWAMVGSVTTHLARTLTGVGLALSPIGAVWAVIKRDRSALLLIPAVTWLAVLFGSARVVQLRYLLPPAFILAVFAGYIVYVASQAKSATLRWVALTAASFALVVGLARGINLTFEMLEDSRYEATRWMSESLPEGSRVEFFGPFEKLPHLPPGVRAERAATYFGALLPPAVDSAAASAIARRWRASPPDAVIIIPDYLSADGSEIGGACPPEIYARLISGELGFRLATAISTPQLLPFVGRPPLDYPTVNPPIRIFVPVETTEQP